MAKQDIIRPVKGTRDFYPPVMARRNWLYANMRKASEAFGYQEYEAPILETLELYAAKSGEELVKEQAFVFNDRGGDQITLRPELTPSLARLVAQQAKQLTRPIRWWSFGPFWRYERPQKGRTREFFQWNVDCLGVEGVIADAEIAAIAVTFMQNIGLSSKQAQVQVNSRRLMDDELANIGIGAAQKRVALQMIDRLDKLSPAQWVAYGLDLGLAQAQVDALSALLQRDELWQQSDELREFFDIMDAWGLRDWFAYTPQVVRGLDYYTGIVMEGRDLSGEHRAIFGGGRYDNLVADVGSSESITGTGFAMGDVVIGLVADDYGATPAFGGSTADVLVTIFDEAQRNDSLRFAAALRAAGLKTEIYPEADKLRKQLKYANVQNIPVAAIIGSEEAASGQVTLKDFASGEQVTVAQSDAAVAVRKMLAGGAPA